MDESTDCAGLDLVQSEVMCFTLQLASLSKLSLYKSFQICVGSNEQISIVAVPIAVPYDFEKHGEGE